MALVSEELLDLLDECAVPCEGRLRTYTRPTEGSTRCVGIELPTGKVFALGVSIGVAMAEEERWRDAVTLCAPRYATTGVNVVIHWPSLEVSDDQADAIARMD